MIKILAFFGAVLMTALIAVPPANALSFKTFQLKNGMEVIVVPDHRSPVVVNFLWYYAGAADEADGVTGIAHMLEHLMFKGTESIPPQEFSKIIAHNGGKDNAFTSYDYTGYFQKIAKQNLEIAMEMEADRMQGLTFTNKQFLPERDVIMEERRMRTDSKPSSRFYEELRKVHFQKHPYGRPVIGWQRDIENFSREKALNWYKKWYVPNNTVLILAGDIKLEEAQKLAEKTYGKIPKGEVNRPVWTNEPLWNKQRRYEKVDKEVKVPIFSLSYRAPSSFAEIAGGAEEDGEKNTNNDALALSLMAELLGGSQTSHLYKKLVKEQKLADAANANYSAVMRGESSVGISVQPKKGVKLSQIEAAVYAEISNFLEKNITNAELERAKTKMKSLDIYARDNVFVSAYHLGRWLMAGGRPENFDAWQEEIKHITVQDIQRVARKYLVKKHSSVGLLTNSQKGF